MTRSDLINRIAELMLGLGHSLDAPIGLSTARRILEKMLPLTAKNVFTEFQAAAMASNMVELLDEISRDAGTPGAPQPEATQ
jgi:hypothetical protein